MNHAMIKRARAGVKGLIIDWVDEDPLTDSSKVIPGNVSHRNPIYRLTARKIFQDHGEFITKQQSFRWLVTIKVVFDYDNGQRQYEERELEAFATISVINEYALEQIQDAMRYGDMSKYRHTEFKIECIGVK